MIKDKIIIEEIDKFVDFFFDKELEVNYFVNVKGKVVDFYINNTHTPLPPNNQKTYQFNMRITFDDIDSFVYLIEMKYLYNNQIKEYRS